MRSRFAAVFLVLVGAVATAPADANPFFDPDGRFSSGRTPGGGFGGLFGSRSATARATVVYPSRLSQGSIVINTAERRLYFILGNGLAILERVLG